MDGRDKDIFYKIEKNLVATYFFEFIQIALLGEFDASKCSVKYSFPLV